jgi:predicted transglutaminase-like protease
MKSLSAHILEKLSINKNYKDVTLNSLSEWIPIKINFKNENFKFEAIAPVRVVSTYIYEEFSKKGHTRSLSEIAEG